MDLPRRKNIRLSDYNYAQAGAYFITICTKNKCSLLWDFPVGATSEYPALSRYGQIVDNAINNIHKIYTSVEIDKYVIMPNHVHMIIRLSDNDGRALPAPTEKQSIIGKRLPPFPRIGNIIQQTKGYTSKQIGFPIWQKGFYDHIIRNEQDYLTRWKYIDENPLKWQDDELFQE